jgi:hypothetical protein
MLSVILSMASCLRISAFFVTRVLSTATAGVPISLRTAPFSNNRNAPDCFDSRG